MKVISCAVEVDLVGTDVLGDTAGLAGDDVGLADLVEQKRLAVVDVTHDRHDRRARPEILFALVVFLFEVLRLELCLLLLARGRRASPSHPPRLRTARSCRPRATGWR